MIHIGSSSTVVYLFSDVSKDVIDDVFSHLSFKCVKEGKETTVSSATEISYNGVSRIDMPEEIEVARGAEIEEQVLFDNDMMTVTAKNLFYVDEFGYKLGLTVEDKTDEEFWVRNKCISVNGFMFDGFFSETVAPHTTKTSALELYNYRLSEFKIDHIYNVAGEIEYSGEKVFTYSVDAKLSVDVRDPWDSVGIVIYEENGVSIKVLGWSPPTYGSENVVFELINNTDRKVAFNTTPTQLVNDQQREGGMWMEALPHTRDINYLYYFDITAINTMAVTFVQLNSEKYNIIRTMDPVYLRMRK